MTSNSCYATTVRVTQKEDRMTISTLDSPMPAPTGKPNRRSVFTSFPWQYGRVYMSHTWYYDVKFTGPDAQFHFKEHQATFGGDPVQRQDGALALRYPYDPANVGLA